MSRNLQVGKKGEDRAVRHLLSNGYQILERNWRWGKAEIDVIAKIGNEVVFIEVKTRKTAFFGEPETFVSARQQQLILEGAHQYLQENKIDDEARFDIIGIVDGESLSIEHFVDAFSPF